MNITCPCASESDSQEQFSLDTGSGSIALGKGEIRSFTINAGASVEIHILEGAAWVTMEADSNDYALEAGDSVVFAGPGLLVAEGIADCSVMEQRDPDRTLVRLTPTWPSRPGFPTDDTQ